MTDFILSIIAFILGITTLYNYFGALAICKRLDKIKQELEKWRSH